ncbi:synembryn [Diabrotica virgifera virgifera]|uniref:Synembryn n=1 Tax=Diabrotica virgifera virgifera TaxID=50390 RepID=A0A6P7FFX1_DIAVI|nr:synembryn [Diabrotica virgifera virgifera]
MANNISDIDAIILAEKDTWATVIDSFVKKSLQVFSFPELANDEKRKNVWTVVYNIAKDSDDPIVTKNCFIAVRILSREKEHLSEVISDDWINLIKHHSGLDNEHFEYNDNKSLICVEVLKSLSNILFNSKKIAEKSLENGILEGLTKRIKHKNKKISDDIRFMDIRLVFLITALCPEARNKVFDMIDTFNNVLEEVLQEAAKNHLKHEDLPPIYLTPAQAEMVSEILKALFNLTIRIEESDVETMATCIELVKVLRSYLLISSSDLEKTWILRNDVINLLTNMPEETYSELLPPVSESHQIIKSLEFEGKNMTAIYEMTMFLKAKFNDQPDIYNQHEILSPIVTVLLKGATTHRPIRKFLRNQILPPLKDVHTRPEEGNTLRNHLCRLLTTPVTQLRDLVADLLFVLCKNNVARMIKYTGYGNAAGLFATKGVLAGGRYKGEDDYDSESEDSDTDEYNLHKHGINPVIGCYEEPHPSASEQMTEEQKEYEAMKLVVLLDSLMKCGSINPCVVGKDGKPEPITHVLQLQEGLKEGMVKFLNEDSD